MGAPIDGECLIAGGGPVGSTLALALGRAGVRTLLVDAGAEGPLDDRSYALTLSSIAILQALGLWPALGPGATAIRALHVTDAGRFGFARIDAQTVGLPALGYVVPAAPLQEALRAALEATPALTVLQPAEIREVTVEAHEARLVARRGNDTMTLRAPVLIGADGGLSRVRAAIGIEVEAQDYVHDAIVATVTVERDPAGVAYERFTANGPFALLPRGDGRCGVVWTMPRAQTREMLALDDAAFCARAQLRFGRRLGAFSRAGPRASFPLRAQRARRRSSGRALLLGNAARIVHPTAAQGLNLALRDAAAVAEYLLARRREGGDPGEPQGLAAFARRREFDHRRGGYVSDGLARLFTSDLGPVAFARNAGLSLLNLLPPVQRAFLNATGGLTGSVPRLARGIAP